MFSAQVPKDEWDRYFSVSISHPQTNPVLLTTTDGLINDGVADRTFTTTALSRDRKTLFYSTNATDIEKRHIWAVPTSGGTPIKISTDVGVEVSPTPLGSGKSIAVLYFNGSTHLRQRDRHHQPGLPLLGGRSHRYLEVSGVPGAG